MDDQEFEKFKADISKMTEKQRKTALAALKASEQKAQTHACDRSSKAN